MWKIPHSVGDFPHFQKKTSLLTDLGEGDGCPHGCPRLRHSIWSLVLGVSSLSSFSASVDLRRQGGRKPPFVNNCIIGKIKFPRFATMASTFTFVDKF